MDDLEKARLYKEQTDDIYRSIGKFSVKFEQIVHSMSVGITMMLSMNGLKNQQLSHIMLAELTAYPTKSIFGSMIAEVGELSDKDKQILNGILKRIQTLIDSRNDIVHSTWFVGWASPKKPIFDEVSGHKLTRGKSGADVKGFKFKSKDFDELSHECELVNELVMRLWGVALYGNSIEKNFVVSVNGEISVPPVESDGS